MRKKLKATLENILVTQSFDRLDEFKTASSWTRMSGDERHLLANLFVIHGEKLLKAGDSHAVNSFQLANQVSGREPRILYRQGLAFAAQRNNGSCLRLAAVAFQEAAEGDPSQTEVWEAWGSVLVRQGLFYGEMAYFHEADEKFQEAARLIDQQPSTEADSCLYRHWGESWYCLGRHSGEAMDFRLAVEKFQEAERLGANGASFWKDYGNALYELGILIGRHELIGEAVESYEKAVARADESFSCWLHLASGLKGLYEWTGKEGIFIQAVEAFDRAAQLNDDCAELWWRWGELLGLVGWVREDVQILKQSAEKLACADLCEGDNPTVLCLWGTVLMHCGALSERLPLLKQAEEKILRSVELDPDDVEAWCAYGSCLCELGCYFGDDEYYLQAISRFQYALTLEPENARLWQGLGQAQFAAGELQGDLAMMERALDAYAKATDCDRGRGPEAWADWGVALMKLGDLLQDKKYIQAAVQRFEQAINLHCEGDRREVHWLYHYGCALDILGDFQEGATYYERSIQVLTHVLSVDPQHRPARHNLALALFHLGEVSSDIDFYSKALAEFEVVVAGDEEDEIAWNDWGLTLLSFAQLVEDPSRPEMSHDLLEEAGTKLTRAAALGSVQAFYNLACLYSLVGRLSESMDHLRRANTHQALPPLEDLVHDDWLEAVRRTPEFQEFKESL